MSGKHMFPVMIFAALALIGSAMAKPDGGPSAAAPRDRQAVDELVRQCVSLTCRTSTRHFSLHAADGKTVEGETLPFPYVNDKGTVIVYPDETVSVSLARQGDKLAPPVFVAATDPDGTTALKLADVTPANLSFQLRQLDSVPGTVLVITNQIDANIKFDLVMYVPVAGGMRAVHTSSCPLLPPQNGQQSFAGVEHWPHPVMMVAIADIHILSPDSPRVCE
jgi:hypothetical protein